MTPYNLDLSGDSNTGAPYLTNTYSGDGGDAGTYTFSITTGRPTNSAFTDLLVCAWDVTAGGNPTTADYQSEILSPTFDSNASTTATLAVNGGDAICTRASLTGTTASGTSFTDYSDLAGGPNGTLCSAGDFSATNCPYVGPNAVVGSALSACNALLSLDVPALGFLGAKASTYHLNGCPPSGWRYGGASVGEYRPYYLSYLNWYYTGSHNAYWYCYELYTIPCQEAVCNNQNGYPNFDFDDQWSTQIRVWHCGSGWGVYTNSSGTQRTGPAAIGDSPTNIYYGSCGTQADDSGSFAFIDQVRHYFPYVSLNGQKGP